MDDLPKDRIDAIPPKPEHLVSNVLNHPAPWPEEHKIWISRQDWERLIEKYSEEEVSRYYRIKADGQ